MAALSWSSMGKLRCLTGLRSLFVWLLLALLITGAASYTHGSRYAIVPSHGLVQATDQQRPHDAPQTGPAVGSPATPASASQVTGAAHRAGPSLGAEEAEKDCCERRHAPHGEPAPIRTGALDPPSTAHPEPGDGVAGGTAPPEPDLPALTVIKLSISRT